MSRLAAPPQPAPGLPADARGRIAAATFGILALELALIRWTAGQIRILAYFSNLAALLLCRRRARRC